MEVVHRSQLTTIALRWKSSSPCSNLDKSQPEARRSESLRSLATPRTLLYRRLLALIESITTIIVKKRSYSSKIKILPSFILMKREALLHPQIQSILTLEMQTKQSTRRVNLVSNQSAICQWKPPTEANNNSFSTRPMQVILRIRLEKSLLWRRRLLLNRASILTLAALKMLYVIWMLIQVASRRWLHLWGGETYRPRKSISSIKVIARMMSSPTISLLRQRRAMVLCDSYQRSVQIKSTMMWAMKN